MARCLTRRSLLLSCATLAASAALRPRVARAATGTISDVIGVSAAQVVAQLSAHMGDNFYLRTPYDGVSDSKDYETWNANGSNEGNGHIGMNCTGFILRVIMDCGGHALFYGDYLTWMTPQRYCNLCNMEKWLSDHAQYVQGSYSTKAAMLASGILEKGDIIIMDPRGDMGMKGGFVDGGDCHIAFFWGDSPSQDLAWHSSSHGDGIVLGNSIGTVGNVVSQVTPKTPNSTYWVVKLAHDGWLDFHKRTSAGEA